MLSKIIILFLIVGQIILASTSYVEEGKRAKLFEIMDKEVPTFRVTISDDKLEELKQCMQNEKVTIAEATNGGEMTGKVVDFEKVKNATLVVEINDKVETFNKVTFDIGGSSARIYGRQGFNIKIRDKKKDLYGRTDFRIRSDPRDATFLRSKLCCDMLNRLDIPSISANYIKLYVNEEYFGFYVFMDAPKIKWIEQVFGEKDTTSLYKCKGGGAYLTRIMGLDNCENEEDKFTDRTEWYKLLDAIDNAQTVEEIEDIFDVDHFLYLAAFEYLIGAWDHFLLIGHNYSMYKNKETGKWTILYYDFDSDLGQDVVTIEYMNFVSPTDKNYPHHGVRQWFHLQTHIADIAIWNNLPRFEAKLRELVEKVFNPTTLFPHIDDLKDFIRPYVKNDKTPNEHGIHPGVLNLANPTDYSMEEWEANSEFTTIHNDDVSSEAYGIKYWILERYRTVCKEYKLECDPVYMDKNYKYHIDKKVEGELDVHKWENVDWRVVLGIPIEDETAGIPTEEPTGVSTEEPTEEPNEKPAEKLNEKPNEKSAEKLNEKPNEKPAEKLNEKPNEKPKPVEKPKIISFVDNAEAPAEEPNKKQDEEVVDEPTEAQVEDSAEDSAEDLAEEVDESTEVSVEDSAEEVDGPTEASVEDSAEE